MTIKYLESYRSRLRQLKTLAELLEDSSYLKGIDPSRISVQSGAIGNPTAEIALHRFELEKSMEQEYLKLSADLKSIQDYIFSIEDTECREIAIRRCIKGQTYEQIGKDMFMHRTTVSRKLEKYIAHNAH